MITSQKLEGIRQPTSSWKGKAPPNALAPHFSLMKQRVANEEESHREKADQTTFYLRLPYPPFFNRNVEDKTDNAIKQCWA
jgi:hypothetical protein